MAPDAAATDAAQQSTARDDPRLLRLGAFMRPVSIHTAAWLPRSFKYRKEIKSETGGDGSVFVRRFRPFDRNLHLMVITSFLGLALTGRRSTNATVELRAARRRLPVVLPRAP